VYNHNIATFSQNLQLNYSYLLVFLFTVFKC
jgi:hypothetical protein